MWTLCTVAAVSCDVKYVTSRVNIICAKKSLIYMFDQPAKCRGGNCFVKFKMCFDSVLFPSAHLQKSFSSFVNSSEKKHILR